MQINFIMEVDSQPEKHLQPHQQPPQQKKLKCVCELCTCGQHHCPRPRIKGNFSTSYSDHYQKLNFHQASFQRPQYQYQQKHYNPEVIRTSYQDNYHQPLVQVNPESPKQDSYPNKIPYRVPFYGSSSYKQQFKPFSYQAHSPNKSMESPKVQSQPQYPRSPVKFEGISAYKSQFMSPPKVESKPIEQSSPYKKVHIPFYGSSSYKKDFQGFSFQPQQSVELMPSYKKPPVRFEGRTSYNDQFQGYSLRAPERSPPVHECVVDRLSVPQVNYVNDQKHIYYDPENKKFI